MEKLKKFLLTAFVLVVIAVGLYALYVFAFLVTLALWVM